MDFVESWINKNKTPVPYKNIMEKMLKKGKNKLTIKLALKALKQKGFIREAVTVGTNRKFYVQLRRV